MKTQKSLILVLAATLFLTVSTSFAQQWKGWRGSGGWGPGSSYSKMYNPRTVQIIKGTVESIDIIEPARGMSHGIHIVVRSGSGLVDVHLGPAWYIENQDVKIEYGDAVEVKGSRVIFQNAPVIIASVVTKESSVLVLRDDAGVPVWTGWRSPNR